MNKSHNITLQIHKPHDYLDFIVKKDQSIDHEIAVQSRYN